MNWIKKRLFPAEDHKKDDAIFRLIFPSLLGIILCGICLAGTTWAWYSASTQSTIAPFQSAHYGMEVTVTGNATQIQPNSFTLEANETYTVKLRATGTASIGYGQIQLFGGTYYTQPVSPGATFTFTVETGAQSENLTVIPTWGRYSGETLANDTVLSPVAQQSETEPTEATEPTETEPTPTETEPEPTETEPTPTETEPAPTETEPAPPAATEPTQPTQQPTQPPAG